MFLISGCFDEGDLLDVFVDAGPVNTLLGPVLAL